MSLLTLGSFKELHQQKQIISLIDCISIQIDVCLILIRF